MISIAQELEDSKLSKDKGDAWEMIEVGKETCSRESG